MEDVPEVHRPFKRKLSASFSEKQHAEEHNTEAKRRRVDACVEQAELVEPPQSSLSSTTLQPDTCLGQVDSPYLLPTTTFIAACVGGVEALSSSLPNTSQQSDAYHDKVDLEPPPLQETSQHSYLSCNNLSSIEAWRDTISELDPLTTSKTDAMTTRDDIHVAQKAEVPQGALSAPVAAFNSKQCPNIQGTINITPPASLADLAEVPTPTVVDDKSDDSAQTIASKLNNPCNDPNYRFILRCNGVLIDVYDNLMPEAVRTMAYNITTQLRDTPSLGVSELINVREGLQEANDGDESVTQKAIESSGIIPPLTSSCLRIGRVIALAEGGNVPFTRKALPRQPEAVWQISTPKPDRYYGYKRDLFDNRMHSVMNQARLKFCAMPTKSSLWTFLAIEYKAQSRSGLWPAINQNAGTGALCVNAMEILMGLAWPQERWNATDTMFFSFAITTEEAALFVHCRHEDWLGEEDERNWPFISAEVDNYRLNRPDQVQKLHTAMLNIMEWSLKQRLPKIKEALERIADMPAPLTKPQLLKRKASVSASELDT